MIDIMFRIKYVEYIRCDGNEVSNIYSMICSKRDYINFTIGIIADIKDFRYTTIS